MNPNHFWNLFAKKLSGEATEADEAELERLIKTYPELTYAAQHLTDLWKQKPPAQTAQAEAAFEKHQQKIQPAGEAAGNGRKKNRPYGAVIAATCLITLTATAWFLLKSKSPGPLAKPHVQKAEVYTRHGNRTKLVLPDSSVVWLNAGSRLTYEPDFGSSNRNTTLVGEAFFDVRKSTVPFVISAKGIRIKVLGTAFNVKSYPDERTTETSLLRGRVEVTLDKRPGETIVLKPNEKLIVSNAPVQNKTGKTKTQPLVVLRELEPVTDGSLVETSWVENKLVFQDETLEEVARKMERWYNVRIAITDPALSQLRVGGGPFENETIEQALTALQIAFNFKFTVNGSQITITR